MLPMLKFMCKVLVRFLLIYSLDSKVTHFFPKTGQPNSKMEDHFSKVIIKQRNFKPQDGMGSSFSFMATLELSFWEGCCILRAHVKNEVTTHLKHIFPEKQTGTRMCRLHGIFPSSVIMGSLKINNLLKMSEKYVGHVWGQKK